MPRYLIDFEDGTQEQMGFPGPDSDKIQRTAQETAYKRSGKKVIALKLLQQSKATKKEKKNKELNNVSKKKGSKLVLGKKAKEYSLKSQIDSLENTLVTVIGELKHQIQGLKTSILLAKKHNLISQLEEIESQL